MTEIQLLAEKQPERRDSLLFSIALHVLLLLLCVIPLLNLNPTPKEPTKGITVVFSQEDVDRPSPIDSDKSKETQSAKVEQKEKVSKVKLPQTKDIPIKSEPITTPVESEAPKSEKSTITSEIVNVGSEVVAAEKASDSSEELEKELNSKKALLGSLFGTSNNTGGEEGQEIEIGGLEKASNTSMGGSSSGSLASRMILSKPEIKDDSLKEGRVVVKICVDAGGKVISTKYQQNGSTTTDTHLIQKALEGVKQYTFSKSDSSTKDCGEINIDFKVE